MSRLFYQSLNKWILLTIDILNAETLAKSYIEEEAYNNIHLSEHRACKIALLLYGLSLGRKLKAIINHMEEKISHLCFLMYKY